MSTSFSVSFPAPVNVTGNLIAFNTGNQDLGFQISGAVPSVELQPNEIIKYMIAPTGLALTDTQSSGILRGQTTDDSNTGQFFAYLENTTRTTKRFEYPQIIFPKDWENTKFNLYWLHRIPEESYLHFGSSSSVYSFPHNLEPSEIKISGGMSSDEKVVNYSVTYPALKNEGTSDYGGGNDLPYAIYVEYTNPDNSDPYDVAASGFTGWKYYPSGSSISGISFSLPFYDERNSSDEIPATYTFNINYNSAGSVQPGSTPLQVQLDHSHIKNNFFSDLTAYANTNAKKEDLQEVDTIDVPANIIHRKRLAIGIEDIKSVERVFEKTGVYVSDANNLDFSIYTFSLKVDEYIPEYSGINKYNTVKYYAQFNNGEWIRISPINRSTEMQDSTIIPKMLVFNTVNDINEASLIKYIDINGIINNFRIKIIFDASAFGDSVFVPPEIRSYKCMILDKQHFANFEA